MVHDQRWSLIYFSIHRHLEKRFFQTIWSKSMMCEWCFFLMFLIKDQHHAVSVSVSFSGWLSWLYVRFAECFVTILRCVVCWMIYSWRFTYICISIRIHVFLCVCLWSMFTCFLLTVHTYFQIYIWYVNIFDFQSIKIIHSSWINHWVILYKPRLCMGVETGGGLRLCLLHHGAHWRSNHELSHGRRENQWRSVGRALFERCRWLDGRDKS